MLDEPHAVEAELVGKLDLRHAVGEHGLFAAAESRRYGKLVEQVEEQGGLLLLPELVYCQRSARNGSSDASKAPTPIVRNAEPSTTTYEDPLARIDWNGVDRDCWWLPPAALSLAGVAEFEALPLESRRRLSHYEYAHLLEIGVWLEALFIERLARLVRRSGDFERRNRYLEEIREEAGHSLMFVELIRRSGVALPSRRSLGLSLAEALGRGVSSGSALFWAMVVIGEELPYRLTRRLERGVEDVMLSAVVYRMAQMHGRDEAAHAAYARACCEEATAELRRGQRMLLSPLLSRMLSAFSAYLYFPPMAVYRCANLTPGARWRSLALGNRARRQQAAAMLRPTLDFLRSVGWRVMDPFTDS